MERILGTGRRPFRARQSRIGGCAGGGLAWQHPIETLVNLLYNQRLAHFSVEGLGRIDAKKYSAA